MSIWDEHPATTENEDRLLSASASVNLAEEALTQLDEVNRQRFNEIQGEVSQLRQDQNEVVAALAFELRPQIEAVVSQAAYDAHAHSKRLMDDFETHLNQATDKLEAAADAEAFSLTWRERLINVFLVALGIVTTIAIANALLGAGADQSISGIGEWIANTTELPLLGNLFTLLVLWLIPIGAIIYAVYRISRDC